MGKLPDDTSLAESSTAEKRPVSDADENAKRAKVVPEIPIIHNLTEDSTLDQNIKLTLLQQLARQTEAVKDVQKTMTTMNRTLENGFQSLNATLNRLANAMAKPAPPPSRRPFVPVLIQKKTDNNNNQ
jgi:uncharacterized protein YccT (UPF0319 family)